MSWHHPDCAAGDHPRELLGHFPPTDPRVTEMFQPVRCGFCNEIYDLGKVDVTARYADCRGGFRG